MSRDKSMRKYSILGSVCLCILLCASLIMPVNAQKEQKNMQEKSTLVLISTTMGNIKVRLYNETPLHRDNFIKLVNEGYYDSLLFHRVINNFMIQGGDPQSKNAPAGVMLGNGGPDYTIPAEIRTDIKHKKGALAAARMGDMVNPERASSGSQFYLVQNDNGTPHLDGAYTVFGETVEGLDVIDKIAQVRTDRYNRPIEDVRIISMKIVKK